MYPHAVSHIDKQAGLGQWNSGPTLIAEDTAIDRRNLINGEVFGDGVDSIVTTVSRHIVLGHQWNLYRSSMSWPSMMVVQ